MQKPILIGFGLLVAVVAMVLTSVAGFSQIFDARAFALIFGGTFAALFVFLRPAQLKSVWSWFRSALKAPGDQRSLAEDILRVAETWRTRPGDIQTHLDRVDPFLKEGFGLLRDGILDDGGVAHVLKSRVYTNYQIKQELGSKLKSFQQIPAALGLLGAMIAATSAVHQLTIDAPKEETVSMVTFGLLSLVYGVGFGHLILSPLAKALSESAKADRVSQTLVAVGCRLIARRSNPVVVAEELNSYLPAEDRIDWRRVLQSAEGTAA